MLASACLSSICNYHQSEVHHKLVGCLLFSSSLYALFVLFSPYFFLLSVFFNFFVHYYFTSLPCFITYNSFISLPSAMPSVPARSPFIPWPTFLPLSALSLSCFATKPRYGRTGIFAGNSASSSKYLSLCLFVSLCALVHEVECNVRNSDFVHISFPFLSLPLPSLPYILHILLVLEQCYRLNLITN